MISPFRIGVRINYKYGRQKMLLHANGLIYCCFRLDKRQTVKRLHGLMDIFTLFQLSLYLSILSLGGVNKKRTFLMLKTFGVFEQGHPFTGEMG
jgi:hypothetical protein